MKKKGIEYKYKKIPKYIASLKKLFWWCYVCQDYLVHCRITRHNRGLDKGENIWLIMTILIMVMVMVTVMWWGWWCCLLRWWCGGNGDGDKWLELRCLHDDGAPPLLNWRTITRSNGNLAIRTSPEEIWFYCPGKMWWNHLRVDGGQESQIVHPKNNLSLFICHSHLCIFSTIISFTYKNTYNLYVPMPHYCLVLLNFLNIVSTCQFWIENPVLICLDKRRERATEIVETENTF